MVRIIEEKKSSPAADRIRGFLPRDPSEGGFRRVLQGDSTLDFEADIGPSTIRVRCDLMTTEGKRWLSLAINKFPLLVGFRDVSFVRRAFLGPDRPAIIYYGPDDVSIPTGNLQIVLWTPLDEAIFPSGFYRSTPP
jgi:hypothetical protein